MISRVFLASLLSSAVLIGLTCVAPHARAAGSEPSATRTPVVAMSAALQPDFRPNRFMVFVFANPMLGKDAGFDDWYENQHVPDLLDLPGYYGAQRFRLSEPGAFSHNRVVIWHVEGDRELSQMHVLEALATGKTRRSDSFDWTPGAILFGIYEPISERITNPAAAAGGDAIPAGKKRFVWFEFTTPTAGKEMLFGAQAERRLRDVVTVPGWVAGQRYRKVAPLSPPAAAGASSATAPAPSSLTRYLTIYDVVADDPKAARAALTKAEQVGKVRLNTTVDAGPAAFFLDPLSGYVKKSDWHPEVVTK